MSATHPRPIPINEPSFFDTSTPEKLVACERVLGNLHHTITATMEHAREVSRESGTKPDPAAWAATAMGGMVLILQGMEREVAYMMHLAGLQGARLPILGEVN